MSQRPQSQDQQMEMSDDNLMARIADRNEHAFRQLIAEHADLPFRIACRMIGDAVEAEDVTQEALLRLWNNAENWKKGGSGIAAWLTRVATNICIDRLRKRKRTSDEEVPDEPDNAPLADEKISESEQELAVKNCISRLGERQRAAVILTYYEEKPNLEAAGTLDMKIKAFESLLYRARGSLKDCLESSPAIGAVLMGGRHD